MKDVRKLFALCCFFVIATSLIMPAYAEVKSLKTDKTFYIKGEKITFSGTVGATDAGDLVTIVIEDPNSTFVRLAQAYPDVDDKFQATVDTKTKFVSHGIYNATAFITNKAEGITINFDFSLDGSPVIHPQTETEPDTSSPPETSTETQTSDNNENPSEQPDTSTETSDGGKSIQDKIKERIEMAKKLKESQNNPPTTVPSANQTASSNSTATNDDSKNTNTDSTTEEKSDISGVATAQDLGSNLYVIIGLVGGGAVAAGVYVAKVMPRHRTVSESDYSPVKKTESGKPSLAEEDYAMMILKNRLAKGEISVEEFNERKRALQEP